MNDLPQPNAETYLGDGLYASFDGYQIMLRAPRPEGDHWIGLEPAVYRALRDFVRGYPKLAAHFGETPC
jgi:hypothetical protein